MIKRLGIVLLATSLVALGTAGSALAQLASGAPPAAPWQEGKNYFVIEPAQPSSTPGKIEVTEVFSYGCPACNAFLSTAEKIKKSLPANAVMTYVPAAFNAAESWPMFQRAYLTAKALGIAEKSHDAVFQSVWGGGDLAISPGSSGKLVKREIPDAAKFYAQYGVRPADFEATANSFAINTQVKKADAFVRATGIDQTPTLIVAGKYRVTASSAGSNDKLVELVRYLIDKESAGG